jgi:hypothetical protein
MDFDAARAACEAKVPGLAHHDQRRVGRRWRLWVPQEYLKPNGEQRLLENITESARIAAPAAYDTMHPAQEDSAALTGNGPKRGPTNGEAQRAGSYETYKRQRQRVDRGARAPFMGESSQVLDNNTKHRDPRATAERAADVVEGMDATTLE